MCIALNPLGTRMPDHGSVELVRLDFTHGQRSFAANRNRAMKIVVRQLAHVAFSVSTDFVATVGRCPDYRKGPCIFRFRNDAHVSHSTCPAGKPTAGGSTDDLQIYTASTLCDHAPKIGLLSHAIRWTAETSGGTNPFG